MTKRGFLVIGMGHKLVDHPTPDFKPIVENIKAIQDILVEANFEIKSAFSPVPAETVFDANSFGSAGERPLRVLSLDGGGVRGLSALYILQEVMKKFSSDKEVKPCEVFDMIGGTSTGGLIAIMLGRLKMSVSECIAEYEAFARKIFQTGFFGKKAHFVTSGTFYDGGILEGVIKDIIGRKIGNQDAKLLDEENNCKVFVMAVREDAPNNREPVFLRSYRNKQKLSLLPDCLLWQAGRATSAAPVYFPPIKIGNYTLVDGGLGANNPLGWLWNEVLDVFGSDRRADCFLSIGTGIPQNKPLGSAGIIQNAEIAKSLAAAATNSQLTHILFKTLIDAYAPMAGTKKYWRLNVSEGIPEHEEVETTGYLWWKEEVKVLRLDNYKDVGELDDVGKIDFLRAMTAEYIKLQGGLIDDCASKLRVSL